MLKQILACGLAMVAFGAEARTVSQSFFDEPHPVYDVSYLQVEACFASDAIDQEACFIDGIEQCIEDIRTEYENRGLLLPPEVDITPTEYCNAIGLERADQHLNAIYQRTINIPTYHGSEWAVKNIRSAQRLWIQYRDKMCSQDTIQSWHAGGSGWGTVFDECATRLTIQQARNLERYFWEYDYN